MVRVLADAVMVARGDLGVEMPPEDVPPIQKQIIQACRMAGKPVVVATQMLESMTASATPTRAEASDVATAIYKGADAVMLSAESASGAYPVEAVEMMNRIICRVERDPFYRALTEAGQLAPERTPSDAISKAARQVAQTIGAAAIVSYTTSGATTLRRRPGAARGSHPRLDVEPKHSATALAALGVRIASTRVTSRASRRWSNGP
jgi:pyruvate kinase